MSSFESISALVKDDLEETNRFMFEVLHSSVPLIHDVVNYTLSAGGKRIRPLLLLLLCKALSIHDPTRIRLAAVLELIHSATLLHDDVVDDSNLRRGRQTPKMIFGNPASVLVGDYVYARAFQLVSALNHPEMLSVFSDATNHLAEGELMQLGNCRNPETSEAFYFDVIHHKTAKLFEMAAHLAGLLSTFSPEKVRLLAEFGLHLGLAFQITDDALDYTQPASVMGKTLGQDFNEGKVTLPLIYTIRSVSNLDQLFLKALIEQEKEEIEPRELSKVMQLIESTNAIEYTLATAKQHISEALQKLACLPDGSAKEALQHLCEFCIYRTY